MRSTCSGCNRVFSSLGTFDKHRAGSYSKFTRHCLTVEEMKERGIVESKGIFKDMNASTYWQQKQALHNETTASQDEQETALAV